MELIASFKRPTDRVAKKSVTQDIADYNWRRCV